VVVLVLPASELFGKLLGTLELRAPIELVHVGSMAALHLPVALGTPTRDPAVQNADILEVPGEVGAELRTVVGLNPLDRHRQAPTHLVDERDRGLDRVVVVDLQDSEASCLVNGRELVEPESSLRCLTSTCTDWPGTRMSRRRRGPGRYRLRDTRGTWCSLRTR
jgi:hypothetical protein